MREFKIITEEGVITIQVSVALEQRITQMYPEITAPQVELAIEHVVTQSLVEEAGAIRGEQ